MTPSRAEKEIDRLYALPLEEFTKARNALARKLREAGERDEAENVKSLRKPTVAAWVVNQLARREKMNVRALLTAGERLRDAHRRVLEGRSPKKVEEARADERRALAALAESARNILKEHEHPASESLLDEVRDSLHAAAVDADLAERVRSGRLTRGEQALGFGFEKGQARGKQPARRQGAGSRESERKRRREALEEKVNEAQTRFQETREQLRSAEKEAERARTASAKAERLVRERQTALERAEETLRSAKERLGREGI